MIDKEKYLPVGTVVLLKGGNKRVMITNIIGLNLDFFKAYIKIIAINKRI